MPQASDELRDRMNTRFGDPIAEEPPWDYLASHGYTAKRGHIFLPTPLHRVTDLEGECIDFLCDEWDWVFDNGVFV